MNDTNPAGQETLDTMQQSRNNILKPIENVLDIHAVKNKILADLNNLQNLQFTFRKKYSGGYIGSRPSEKANGELQENQEQDSENMDSNDDGITEDNTEKENPKDLKNKHHNLYGNEQNGKNKDNSKENNKVHNNYSKGDGLSVEIKNKQEPALLDLERLIRHLEKLASRNNDKRNEEDTPNGKTLDDGPVTVVKNDRDGRHNDNGHDSNEAKSDKVDERERAMIENTKMLIEYLEGKHNKQTEQPEKQSNNQKKEHSTSVQKVVQNISLLDRAKRVEFKNNLMDMPEMVELKQYIENLKKLSEDKNGEHIVNEMVNNDLSRSSLIHDMKKMFGILERNTTGLSLTDVTPNVRYEEAVVTSTVEVDQPSSMIENNYGDEKPVLFAGYEKPVLFTGYTTNIQSTEVKTGIIPVHETNSNDSTEENTSTNANQPTQKLHDPDEKINYDENSNQINNQSNVLNDEAVERINNEYEIKQTTSQSKLQMTNVLKTLYDLVIDILKVTFKCIDIVVKKIEIAKEKISEEYIELKQKTQKLIKTMVLCLEVEENVINLIKYTRLQENYTNPRLSLHRLRRFVCANPIVQEDNHMNKLEAMKEERESCIKQRV
ncbi:hypothetical protein WDU94_000133 [Cyamophila willieti]